MTAGCHSLHQSISIHAPHTGRDFLGTKRLLGRRHFNPRAHAGRDRLVLIPCNTVIQISIHAPMRGATDGSLKGYHLQLGFQSTRPCGARPGFRRLLVGHDKNFNPRAHAGRDRKKSMYYFEHRISIHAPMRGATFGEPTHIIALGISIHAPMRGATRPSWRPGDQNNDFNPRAHAGRDPSRLDFRSLSLISIHAPMRGATAKMHKKVCAFLVMQTIFPVFPGETPSAGAFFS